MKYFFGILIGAIIGYITNWLAIKMLFRPHYEKRIFGIKVPFTPGLIPKERSRISRSVGETVGKHLLTNDVIINSLSNDKMKEHLKNTIMKKVEEFGNSDKGLGVLLEGRFGQYYKQLRVRFQIKLLKYVSSRLKDDSFIEALSKLIMNKITMVLLEKPCKVKEMFSEQGKLKSIIDNSQNLINKSDVIRYVNMAMGNSLDNAIDEDMKINEIIPLEVFTFIKTYITNERDVISYNLLSMLREEQVKVKLKEAIKDNVLSGMSPLVSMFINVDSVYEKFLIAVDKYFAEDENKDLIISYLNSAITSFGHKQVKEVLNKGVETSKNNLIKTLSEYVVERLITNDIIEDGFRFALDKIETFESYHHILVLLDENYEGKIEQYIKNTIRTFVISGIFEDRLSNAIDNVLDEISNISLKALLRNHDEIISSETYKLIEDMYDSFIKQEAANIIDIIDIPNIVEDQINSFDVDYAEKIILDIASKELSAITWLGALLGGIIGVLSPILSIIGS